MKRMFLRISAACLAFIYVFCTPHVAENQHYNTVKCYTGAEMDEISAEALSHDVKVSGRIFELLFGGRDESEEVLLYPGGSVFGLVIDEDGVCVTSGSTSRVLLVGDRIIKVNGIEVNVCSDVENAVRDSGGKRLEFEIIRGGERMNVSVTPKCENGEYKLGVNLRSHTAGIGTVTFIAPGTLAFGGLGHGVSDADGGYVTVRSGKITPVTLGGCKRGEIGHAGELTGVLRQNTIGELCANNECGVFGTLCELPEYCTTPIPAAKRDEVKSGKAQIISTVKNGKRMTYDIEIEEIDYTSSGSKSFKIKVTDPTLITLTGGIVRGMSGSPIIQNGKLVGAVTHVMVANPTEGYGIFIENMLNSAQSQIQPKAA